MGSGHIKFQKYAFFQSREFERCLTSSLVTLDSAVDSIELMSFCDRKEIEI
jgi:hypothetical protein